jgi:exodeoxyribonuclease VII small subunit
MATRRRSRGAPENPPDADTSDGTTFEEALQRLEAIVDRLEEGDLELADALAAFEDGVNLTRRCAGQLEDAERRIEVLVREGEKWIPRPFAAAEPEESE